MKSHIFYSLFGFVLGVYVCKVWLKYTAPEDHRLAYLHHSNEKVLQERGFGI